MTSQESLFTVTLTRVESYLVMTRRVTAARRGTLEELTSWYRRTQTITALVGPWGFPFGLVWTPVALVRNHAAFKQLRELAQSQTTHGEAGAREGLDVPAGWYPDASSPHALRYWDGTEWTDHVTVEEPLPEEPVAG